MEDFGCSLRRGYITRTKGSCGGRFEYFHRSPASRRERSAWCLNFATLFFGDATPQVGGVSNLSQQNLVMNVEGHGPENDSARKDQQQL
jgi:hypothetical protein